MEIKTAILKQKILGFKYVNSKNVKSERRVEPYKIMFKGQSWYLLGFCCEKECFRVFKITRMREIKALDKNFKRKEINEDLKRNKNDYQFNIVKLKLRFNSSMLYRIIDYYDEDQILQEPGESYLVTAEFPYDEWVYSHILSYGDSVEVIEPQYVVEGIKKRLKNMFVKYKI